MGFSSSGSSGSIQSSTDVILSNPATGQFLGYNAAVSKWQNYAASTSPKRVVTASFAASLAPNSATTDIYRITLTGALSLQTPTGTPFDGQQLQIHLIQDNTGSRGVTFSSGYGFSTAIPSPTLSTTGNALDILGFQYSSVSSKWLLLGIVTGF